MPVKALAACTPCSKLTPSFGVDKCEEILHTHVDSSVERTLLRVDHGFLLVLYPVTVMQISV